MAVPWGMGLSLHSKFDLCVGTYDATDASRGYEKISVLM